MDHGTVRKADLGRWRTAGKSGTAQLTEPGEGFSHERFTSSFIGFAPATRPEMVVAVVLVDLSGVYWGGVGAGPVFREILAKVSCSLLGEPFRDVLRREAVAAWADARTPDPAVAAPPARDEKGDETVMPDLRGRFLREGKALLLDLGASVRLLGAGRVAAQEPKPGAPLGPGRICRLVGSRP